MVGLPYGCGWPASPSVRQLLRSRSPGLNVLLAPAYPTSFYQSPTGFTRASVAAGAALYLPYCAGCHGTRGLGDGTQVIARRKRLPALTGFHVLGRDAGNGGFAMPGFADRLSEDELWELIDYVRTLAGAEPDLVHMFRLGSAV